MSPNIPLFHVIGIPVSMAECHSIHVAGNLPNHMSRFLPIHGLEVLFVN
jgi:hypothetical protein